MPKELQLPALAVLACTAFLVWAFSSAEGVITDKDVEEFKKKMKLKKTA